MYFSAPPSMYCQRSAASKVRIFPTVSHPGTSFDSGRNAACRGPDPALHPFVKAKTTKASVAGRDFAIGIGYYIACRGRINKGAIMVAIIHEIGIRDELQVEKVVVATGQKIRWIETLLLSGVDIIQLGS